MQSTTLRGVFPEPKPTYKRDFVKENVSRIKQMQGVVQNSENIDKREKTPSARKISQKKSARSLTYASKHVLHARSNSLPKSQLKNSPKKKHGVVNKSNKLDLSVSEGHTQNEKISHRAVQTDRPEEICSLYANGTVIYPSVRALKQVQKEKHPKKVYCDHGDTEGVVVSNPHNDGFCDEMQELDICEKNYIKDNILSLKSRTKCISPQEPLKGHQKGVVPKYLKERKEEQKRQNQVDPECPPGHVLLPEDERKETLRVLRQSYADRIKELNNMPVSNDTLKKRQRKMAIEEELKKIEEGIKVFQRPKVYVKINA